ncbi:MAG TPA: cyclic nucleotide-binding domain-containing protein [Gaiellaceae bacterium]
MRFRKDQKIELLSRVPLLARCSKTELARVATLADLVEFQEGETLMREGKPGSEFFVIVDGYAAVTKDGSRLAELGAGDWVGEIALLSDVPRTATVVAGSPLQTLVLTRPGFSALIHDVPSIGTKVLSAVGERLAAQTI